MKEMFSGRFIFKLFIFCKKETSSILNCQEIKSHNSRYNFWTGNPITL